jgi:hypothetical protein
MSILIIYSLVIVFLLAFPLLVLAFVRSPEVSAQKQLENTSKAQVDKVSYGLILAFFVFFSLLTFAIHRGKS